jgi:hypothetical protein
MQQPLALCKRRIVRLWHTRATYGGGEEGRQEEGERKKGKGGLVRKEEGGRIERRRVYRTKSRQLVTG